MTLMETIERADSMGKLYVDSIHGKVILQTAKGVYTRNFVNDSFRAIWDVMLEAEDAEKKAS